MRFFPKILEINPLTKKYYFLFSIVYYSLIAIYSSNDQSQSKDYEILILECTCHFNLVTPKINVFRLSKFLDLKPPNWRIDLVRDNCDAVYKKVCGISHGISPKFLDLISDSLRRAQRRISYTVLR